MNRKIYIYQQENWPNFVWSAQELAELLADARNKQVIIVIFFTFLQYVFILYILLNTTLTSPNKD
jgi:hypothetical protein